ncbi:MAG: DUF3667 domain-containing protein [Saprospiraceae bacterium]|nr:DUF3667 domain-containing protein [Saprospiraceae bacterium]
MGRPGALSYQYSYGSRNRYLSPLSLYTIISVIYFFFMYFRHSIPLSSHT